MKRMLINFTIFLAVWLIIEMIFAYRALPWWAYAILWLLTLLAVNSLYPPFPSKSGEEKAKNG